MRKKLKEAGIEVLGMKTDENLALKRKSQALRKRGLSYKKIAKLFNVWRLGTKSERGCWQGPIAFLIFFQ